MVYRKHLIFIPTHQTIELTPQHMFQSSRSYLQEQDMTQYFQKLIFLYTTPISFLVEEERLHGRLDDYFEFV